MYTREFPAASMILSDQKTEGQGVAQCCCLPVVSQVGQGPPSSVSFCVPGSVPGSVPVPVPVSVSVSVSV